MYVGLSSIISVPVQAGQNAATIKFISGTTFLVGGATLTWGQGYPMATGEIINANFSGNIYFAASGSTAVLGLLLGRSEGLE